MGVQAMLAVNEVPAGKNRSPMTSSSKWLTMRNPNFCLTRYTICTSQQVRAGHIPLYPSKSDRDNEIILSVLRWEKIGDSIHEDA
jgi:hypothetical protein